MAISFLLIAMPNRLLTQEDNAVTGKIYVYTYDNGGNITSKQTYLCSISAGVVVAAIGSSSTVKTATRLISATVTTVGPMLIESSYAEGGFERNMKESTVETALLKALIWLFKEIFGG